VDWVAVDPLRQVRVLLIEEYGCGSLTQRPCATRCETQGIPDDRFFNFMSKTKNSDLQ
jgi:hypothetical protein